MSSEINTYLKLIKKSLPKTCTFLSLARNPEKQYYISARFGKFGEENYTVPQDLKLNLADYSYLQEVLQKQCEEYEPIRD